MTLAIMAEGYNIICPGGGRGVINNVFTAADSSTTTIFQLLRSLK